MDNNGHIMNIDENVLPVGMHQQVQNMEFDAGDKMERSAGQSKEIVDLARFLVADRGQTWGAAIKLIKGLGDVEAESCRIILANYLAAVLLNTQNDKKAARLLGILECFRTPFHQSDKLAPLLLSVGLAINLDVSN